MSDIKELYSLFIKSSGVSIDTRQLRPGEIFFALKGSRTDGHNFIEEAFKKGAKYVIGEKPYSHSRYLQVQNSLRALQKLAVYHRKQLKPKAVIAIVGSNGKTTTKGITATLFEGIGKTFSTPGNWNNHLGLPLTLLKSPLNVEFLILELGDNQPGDLTFLLSLSKPTLIAITNISHDHIGIYGSPEANFEGKMEAVRYALNNHLPLICPSYPANDLFPEMPDYHKWLIEKINHYSLAYILGKEKGDLRINAVGAQETKITIHLQEFKHWNQQGYFNIPLWGFHNCYNVGTALAIFSHFHKWDPELLNYQLSSLRPVSNRGEIIKTQSITWVLDAYNANPISMRYAIDFFLRTIKGKKGLILGGMKELGEYTQSEHESLAEWLLHHEKLSELAFIYLIGEEMVHFKQKWSFSKIPIFLFTHQNEVIKQLQNEINTPLALLLKGSRSYQLENIFFYFKNLSTDIVETS